MRFTVRLIQALALMVALAVIAALVGCGGGGAGRAPPGRDGAAGAGGAPLEDAGPGVAGTPVGADGRVAVIVLGVGGGGGHDARVDARDAAEATPPRDAAGERVATPPGLCQIIPLDPAAAKVTNVNTGKTINDAGFTGGALASGTYDLSSVTHFGGEYAGPTREVWIVDAEAGTLEDAFVEGATVRYWGFALTTNAGTVIAGTPACGGAVARGWSYLANGATLSVHARGSSDVQLFTRR
jgi:hypothetical protein